MSVKADLLQRRSSQINFDLSVPRSRNRSTTLDESDEDAPKEDDVNDEGSHDDALEVLDGQLLE